MFYDMIFVTTREVLTVVLQGGDVTGFVQM